MSVSSISPSFMTRNIFGVNFTIFLFIALVSCRVNFTPWNKFSCDYERPMKINVYNIVGLILISTTIWQEFSAPFEFPSLITSKHHATSQSKQRHFKAIEINAVMRKYISPRHVKLYRVCTAVCTRNEQRRSRYSFFQIAIPNSTERAVIARYDDAVLVIKNPESSSSSPW